jgi:predicted phage baseplate assembly protein
VRIPLPQLDDRRWADLVDEGRALIPLYAPEWTDHNLHDPGITLLDLFAWVAEMDIYQLDRIPDAHKRKFLALVGITPEPPRAARTVVSFTLLQGAALDLPAGVELEGTDPVGLPTGFRTLEPITVVPGQLEQVLVRNGSGRRDVTEELRLGESVGLFGDVPERGAELYLGFRDPWPQDRPVRLFFLFAGPRTGEGERRRLIEETEARRRECRPPFSDSPCPRARAASQLSEEQTENLPPHHGVRLVWEFLTRAGSETVWRPFRSFEVEDGTRAFTLDGRVILHLPRAMATPGPDLDFLSDRLYYVRVRFEAGAYDAPPRLRNATLNGVAAEQAISVGDIDRIEGHEVAAAHLGTGNGRPRQELTVPRAPVQASSFELFTRGPGLDEWARWKARPDFDASRRGDRHFLLEPTSGTVLFGDGEKGLVPPSGVPIFAVYRTTRAEGGNLESRSIRRLMDTPHNRALLPDFDDVEARLEVGHPAAATGGAPAETLAGAVARAVEGLTSSERAVTLEDYRKLALDTPGARLARAEARANLHPSFACLQAPGIVTVVILPDLPVPRPVPSPGLRRAVAAYLRRRRILGTRVEVVGPTYLEVSVRARVRACAGVDGTNLRKKIVSALEDFFHPLRGGPEGKGWPLGRDVYRSEVLQVLDEIVGVDHVLSLELVPNGCEPRCGNVCLAPTWLVAGGPHEIEVQ